MGIPILPEEGKEYTLMEGHTLPPIIFTEQKANALITSEQLVTKNKDLSLATNHGNAIAKVKAVLRHQQFTMTNEYFENKSFNRIEYFKSYITKNKQPLPHCCHTPSVVLQKIKKQS